MKRFFTYFDLLGYRNFMLRNDSDRHLGIIRQLYIHIENALTGKYQKVEEGLYLNNETHNRIYISNYSDTVLIWSESNSVDEFEALLIISHECNLMMNLHCFPIRGAMVYKELYAINGATTDERFFVNTFYGKGLIYAHDLAEDQQWAGMVLDNSVFDIIEGNASISKYCVKYAVPFKNDIKNMFAFRIWLESDQKENNQLEMLKDKIEINFKCYDKWDDEKSVSVKLQNTKDFLQFLSLDTID